MTFEEFFLDHYGEVVRSLTLVVGDRSAAEDLSQEAFARALRSWRRVAVMDRPVGWVYVVALNGARRQWRRDTPSIVSQPVVRIEDPAGAVVTAVQLRVALAALTPRQRAALVLRYLVDLSIADVAVALGCAPGTAKATVHQALKRLRVEMEDDDEG